MVLLKRFTKPAACVIAGGYFAGAAYLYYGQADHVFHPDKRITVTPASAGMVFDKVSFRAADGTALTAWYIPASASRATVLYFHGNAQNLSAEVGVLRMFHELGLSTLALDYRGYGESAGEPSEEGMYQDARAAWDWLLSEKKLLPSDVLVWGRSLGAAVAVELAAEKQPGALVTEATFTSLPDIGQKIYPLYPVHLLARYRYDNLTRIARVRSPALIVHSREDLLVPIEHGRRLYAAAGSERKRFLEIAGPHKGLPYQRVYREGVESFLSEVLGAVPA